MTSELCIEAFECLITQERIKHKEEYNKLEKDYERERRIFSVLSKIVRGASVSNDDAIDLIIKTSNGLLYDSEIKDMAEYFDETFDY